MPATSIGYGCSTSNGEVIHTATNRRLRYGALVDKAAALPVPKQVSLKAPKDFKLLGKATTRFDIPEKVNGSAVFGIDVKRPGMLVGLRSGSASSHDASERLEHRALLVHDPSTASNGTPETHATRDVDVGPAGRRCGPARRARQRSRIGNRPSHSAGRHVAPSGRPSG